MDERARPLRKIVKYSFWSGLAGFAILVLYGSFVYWQLQSIEDPKKCFTTHLYKVKLCPGSSNYVRYNNVPKIFYRALILSEDASFYSHSGFDWFEIKESFRRNLEEWRFARGGSTLTQQLAKNLYLTKEKSLSRKFKEFFIARQIEEKLSKTQILEKYVNVVEFGKNIYGIKKAARKYFNKSPDQLNLLESVYLVSLLPNPVSYSRSFFNKKLNRINLRRMKIILGRLYRTKRITDEVYVYAETLLDTEDWPFDIYYPDPVIPEQQLTIEDELFEELNAENSDMTQEEEISTPEQELVEDETIDYEPTSADSSRENDFNTEEAPTIDSTHENSNNDSETDTSMGAEEIESAEEAYTDPTINVENPEQNYPND